MRTVARAGQLLGLVTSMATMVVLAAAPASAEVPTNDTIAGAKTIDSVPFEDALDTTEATTDAEDAAINAPCGAPATNGSVWYKLTATAAGYIVDVSQSNFSAGVIVATGTPGNLDIVTCGPVAVGFEATQGETYYVMAFSDTPEVPGGQLSIAVSEASPPPTVSMTVDDIGKVNKDGVATISGTYTCDGEADFVLLSGALQQQLKDGSQVRGFFDVPDLKCGGTDTWSIDVTAEAGKFSRGLAATVATTVGCGQLGCNFYDALEVVRLKP